MDFNKVNDMWHTGRFEIAMPISNGKWVDSIGIVCKMEKCVACSYAVLDDFDMFSCYYNDVSDKDAEEYLMTFKPKEVLKFIRKLPKKDYDHWFNKLQKNFPINTFPEYYV